MRFCVFEVHGLGPKLVTGWLNAVDVVASSPQEAAAVATRGRLFGEVELDIPADGWSVRSCAGSLSVLHARVGGPEVMVVGPLFAPAACEPAACECLRQLRASILGWIPDELTAMRQQMALALERIDKVLDSGSEK
jgi:hypothetical protein